MNWAGDEAISNVDLADYIGELLGITPQYKTVHTARAYPRVTDNTKRREIYGDCKVQWRDGIRRLIAEWHPELQLQPVG